MHTNKNGQFFHFRHSFGLIDSFLHCWLSAVKPISHCGFKSDSRPRVGRDAYKLYALP
jgi:hypothetical protein